MQNGMPIALSPIIEGLTAVGTLRYMASLLATSPVEEETARFLGGNLVIRHEPIGVIAGIVPWNYPQTLSSFKYAPALAAGNTIVLKPSPETVLDYDVFAEAFIGGGPPAGVINVVQGGRETRRLPGAAPRRRQGRVHRLNGRRAADRRGVRAAAAPGVPRARRQVGGDHPGRRRPGPGQDRPEPVRRHAGQQRADLLRGHPDPRAALPVRRGRRRLRGLRLVAAGRRRARPGDADRAAGRGAAAGPG